MDAAIRFERTVDHVLAVSHAPEPMSDDEWDDFLGVLRETVEQHGRADVIVSAHGKGGPTVTQRARLSELGSEVGGIRMAVVTDSPFLRGTVTALRWMKTIDARSFSSHDEEKAVNYLGLSREDGVRTLAVLHSLAATGWQQ